MLSNETRNVTLMGLGLCFIFAAYTSQAFIVEPVLASHHTEDPRFSPHAGYYSSSLVFAFFTISNIIAPPIIKFLTTKWSIVIGSTGYSLYMAGFFYLNPIFLYISSVFMGLCAGILWTAVGAFLAQNSNEKTITRNSGIMWIIYMFSMVVGGVFLLFVFSTSADKKMSTSLTKPLFGGFLCFSLIGNLCFVFLKAAKKEEEEENGNYVEELKKTLSLMKSVDMLLLFPIFIFTGVELSFYGTVYTTAISFTTAFSTNTNVLIAWCSITTGLGQVAAGIPLVFFGKRASQRGFSPLVITGCVVGCFAAILVFICVPGKASFQRTDEISLISPSISIALLASFLFGVCDSFVNIALYAYLSVRYSEETTQAFALNKLFHTIPTVLCIYYGSWMQIHWQLLILTICAFVSLLTFTVVETRGKRHKSAM